MSACDHAHDDANAAPLIDIRGLPCARRRGTITAVFDSLVPGEGLELINDHDPIGLRAHLDERNPGAFGWTYVTAGPDAWQVALTKL